MTSLFIHSYSVSRTARSNLAMLLLMVSTTCLQQLLVTLEIHLIVGGFL